MQTTEQIRIPNQLFQCVRCQVGCKSFQPGDCDNVGLVGSVLQQEVAASGVQHLVMQVRCFVVERIVLQFGIGGE